MSHFKSIHTQIISTLFAIKLRMNFGFWIQIVYKHKPRGRKCIGGHTMIDVSYQGLCIFPIQVTSGSGQGQFASLQIAYFQGTVCGGVPIHLQHYKCGEE